MRIIKVRVFIALIITQKNLKKLKSLRAKIYELWWTFLIIWVIHKQHNMLFNILFGSFKLYSVFHSLILVIDK